MTKKYVDGLKAKEDVGVKKQKEAGSVTGRGQAQGGSETRILGGGRDGQSVIPGLKRTRF